MLDKTKKPPNAAAAPPERPARDTRPAAKRRLSPEERARAFVEKAIEFFAEVGFDGGTRELAKRLGVTQPLLYRYFPTKDDLIKEVYQRVYLDRWQDRWDGLLEDRSIPLRRRLEEFYGEYTAAIFNREFMRIYMFAGLRGVPINAWYQQLVEERILKRVCTELRHELGLPARADLVSKDEMEVGWILHGGIVYFGVRAHVYDLPLPEDRPRLIQTAIDIFFENGVETLGKIVRAR